jgi:hypothetical protein
MQGVALGLSAACAEFGVLMCCIHAICAMIHMGTLELFLARALIDEDKTCASPLPDYLNVISNVYVTTNVLFSCSFRTLTKWEFRRTGK